MRSALAVLVLPALLSVSSGASAQNAPSSPSEPVLFSEVQGEQARVISGVQPNAPSPKGKAAASVPGPAVPTIGFIDSPSATCFQPDPAQDICHVNWYYLSVTAAPNYMVSLWVVMNPNVVAKTSGFFQQSMYIPGSQLGIGFKVQCGPPVDDTTSCTAPCTFLKVGNSYGYTIRARDSANLSSANYGTVTCPAFIP